MFPFAPPWDDASPSVTNVREWLDAPAGKHGFVSVRDGHLAVGDKRIRFFGVNMCFGANFPTHDAAERIAGRLAKFGINCVRFHHMDMFNAPDGIFANDGVTLDPERLDRLDYFISQLKNHGIYSNLNLHVSRTYPDRPKSEKVGNQSFDKGVDNFSAKLIALQKDFARDLLSHVNPYTGNAYAQEPAVALVEINNENGLLHSWEIGALDGAAQPYRDELGELWTKWLLEKYADRADIETAWSQGERPAGPELLANGTFEADLDRWNLERHGTARARSVTADGVLRVTIGLAGEESWHAQVNQGGIPVAAGETLVLTFRARARTPRPVHIALAQANAPWSMLAEDQVTLSTEWEEFRRVLKVAAAEADARIGFNVGNAKGWVEIDDVSLRVPTLDGSVPWEGGAIKPFTRPVYAAQTELARRDWYRFLWSLEEKYWMGMKDFLQKDLGAKSLVVGTQLQWSPIPIQARMDVIDSHAYWMHPRFPGKEWDMENWKVRNKAMTGEEHGGTIPGLALQRVVGMPYICTEYNHAAPNSFGSETFSIICAYAALQDWDAVFAFSYSHRRDDWEQDFFSSFFDIDRHPTKMATLPASLALFLRGDVARARTERLATITSEDAFEAAMKHGVGIGAEQFGVEPAAAMIQRVGVALGEYQFKKGATGGDSPDAAAEKVYISDTQELTWDTERRVVLINTARSKAVIGFPGSERFTLGGCEVEFGPLRQGFAVLQITVMEGADFGTAERILVTATSNTENTGMQWTSEAMESVGKNWGSSPTLVEGVPAKIQFPEGGNWKAWALDERGQRCGPGIPITNNTLIIGSAHKTLWYEVTRSGEVEQEP